jgi:hypothetical protein
MKTPEEMAEEYGTGIDLCCGTSDIIIAAEKGFLAGYQAAQQWISVKDRLPTDADGVTQLWMRGRSLAELVLGCHAVMFEYNEKIEGVLDMNKPNGLWDLSDFTHWMPLPKPPEEK